MVCKRTNGRRLLVLDTTLTGLANSAMYAPVAQPYQNIPNGGMPMVGQSGIFAPMSGIGATSGMPASTLPMATMRYSPTYGATSQSIVVQPYLGQTSYYNGQNYNGQVVANPVYSSSLPIGSGVIPTAAWMPSTSACANGMCSQATNQVNTPYVPGATSVTPVGPPTYSATPNSVNGQFTNPSAGYGAVGNAPSAPAYPNPYSYTNPYGVLPAAGQVFPPNQVMPPNMNANPNPNLDPESMRRPNLGGSSASMNVQKFPMVAIDRESNSNQNGETNRAINPNGLLKPRDAFAMSGAAAAEPSPLAPSMIKGVQDIPKTLVPRENYGMEPQSAPDDFDSKPRWTPTLLDPDDRTVMERSSRIRLQADNEKAVSAVALEPVKANRNAIQLVSGVETKKLEPSEISAIRFRPVTTLK